MKVLWFSNSPAAAYEDKLKGTGGWMVELDKAIQKNVELHVAYLYPYKQMPFKNGETTYYPIYSGNIIAENIKKRFLRIKRRDFTNDFLKVIEMVKPDIIHIHGTENTFHTILGKVNMPVVISIQGNPSVIAYKYRSGFWGMFEKEKVGKITLKSMIFGRNSFYDGHNNLSRMAELEQKTLLNAKYIIGRTDWDKRITRVLAPDSKYYVGNEMLRYSFYKLCWDQNQPTDKIVIHTTNGNNYYKGFEVLCYSLSLLNNIGYNIEWRVAGVSEDSKIVNITKRFLGKNYPKKGLKLLGPLDEEKLSQSLLSSHLYVMPSHIENSPNNLCEAMILGMPCIASLAGGTGSILKDKEEGIIVQDGDPWVLAGAIIEMVRDWERAKNYGLKAREKALLRHNPQTIVNNLVNTYKEIINENK